jgi:hypothetical protein
LPATSSDVRVSRSPVVAPVRPVYRATPAR